MKTKRPRAASPRERQDRRPVDHVTQPLDSLSFGNESLEQVADLDRRTVPRDRDHVAPQATPRPGRDRSGRAASRPRGSTTPAARSPPIGRRARADRPGASDSIAARSSGATLATAVTRRPGFAGGIRAIQSWIIRVARSSTWFEPTRGIRPPPSLDIAVIQHRARRIARRDDPGPGDVERPLDRPDADGLGLLQRHVVAQARCWPCRPR